MAERRPLVLVSGRMQELPAGDTLPGGTQLALVSGAGSVQERTILYYNGTTKVATVSPRWRVNSLLRSEEINNVAWTKSRSVVAATDTIAGPDGTVNAEKVAASTDEATHRFYQSISKATSALPYTFSISVKAGEYESVALRLAGSGESDHITATFNLTAGSVVSGPTAGGAATWVPVDASIEDEGGGWYRCSISGVSDTTNTAFVMCYLNGFVNYIGNESDGQYFVGGALEPFSSRGDYIKTEASAITLPDATTGYEVRAGGAVIASGTATAGSVNTLTRQANDEGTNKIALGTVQTATGSETVFDFAVPAGARRIKISLRGLSLSGTDNILIQIGTGGTPATTGYVSTSNTNNQASQTAGVSSTTGFIVHVAGAAHLISGSVTLDLQDVSTNSWVAEHILKKNTTDMTVGAGDVALAGEVNIVRITRTGSNTFDAGSVNTAYER